jgi:SAM-dependent methyltransferase
MAEYDRYYEFYDLLYGQDQHDVPFYLEVARATGGPVCELACGTGRILIPLARAGLDVTGLDVCQPMIDRLHAKLGKEPAEVRGHVETVCADMRTHRFDRRFRLVFCAFNSFLHLKTTEDQLACLRSVRDYLAPDGRLVLNVFAPRYDYLVQERQFQTNSQPDPETGRPLVVVHVSERDWQDQAINVHMHVDRTTDDGTVRRMSADFSLCWIFNREMHLLLRLAGFEVEAVYGGYDRRPYDYVSGTQLFVARKATAEGPN